jgi:REP element-mobilizing transposase RayT
MTRTRAVQLEFGFMNWGGKREGAGAKPKGDKAGVSHDQRPELNHRYPVHVTVRLVEGLGSLRRNAPRRVVVGAFRAGCERFGFRLVHFSIQSNHLHLICEADDKVALSKGMQGLKVRIARGLNKLWGRSGKVFCDRYQAHVLKSLREVKNALCYVLHNAKKHCVRLMTDIDPFSSGRWFDGWAERVLDLVATPLASARTWHLNKGWHRHGLISVRARPAPG